MGSSSLFFEIPPSGLPPPIEEEEEAATQYSATDFQKTGEVIFPFYSKEKENSGFWEKGVCHRVAHETCRKLFPDF